MTPEALRRRMAHGNIYPADKVDAALSQLLPPGQPHRPARTGPAVAGRQRRGGPAALPRAARHRRDVGDPGTGRRRADRRPGGRDADPPRPPASRRAPPAVTCWPCTSPAATACAGSSIAALERQRLLVESLGGSYHRCIGDDIPTAVLDFARANNATQIVIGASRRNPLLAALTGPGTGMTHHPRLGHDRRPRRQPRLRRQGPAAARGRQRADRSGADSLGWCRWPWSCSPLVTASARSATGTTWAWPATCCCSCWPW